MFRILIPGFLLIQGCASVEIRNRPGTWAELKAPIAGPAEVIGSTGSGCLRGAESLPPDGPGFSVMRISRRRFYGHPELLRVIRNAGLEAKKRGWGTLLVGDLSQPRGGIMPTGHASHQSGLDVDLWFQFSESFRTGELTLDERENLSARVCVRDGARVPDPSLWSDKNAALLIYLAGLEITDRIFVDAAIKKQLCEKHPGAAWLAKLRPWWDHADHLHLRLRCPESDGRCVKPEPVPPGTGCDQTLEWWFSDEAKLPAPGTGEKRKFNLPEACDEILRTESGQST